MTDAGPSVTRRAIKEGFPHRNLKSTIIPLPDFGVVYVKNPKAACSTLLLWLDRIHTNDFEHEFGNMHTQHRLPLVTDVGWPEVSRMLSGSAYRFTFVRNPVRRFESAYWDKIVHSRQWRPEVQRVLGLPEDEDSSLTFEQFLDAVEQQSPAEMNPHWRPQHLNLFHPLVTYDRVGRLESFDADLERIREEAGLPKVPLGVRNTSKHKDGTSVYDGRPDLVRRVEQVFAADFEIYGY
ncbi:sulfotransferase family protein [Nocardioides sp. YIM 152588]|uniref:sulfotransferase family protein n=1 Tax=Nocardioides sp. YIM 152588 TaxID=3158259 RepID=UPI0032E4C20C